MSKFSDSRHEGEKRSPGEQLIASLRGFRDQLNFAAEGTIQVPAGTPIHEIEEFVQRGIGVRQFYPGTMRREGETEIYSVVFDLARVATMQPAELPPWIEYAKFKTSDGTTLSFLRRHT